MTIPEGVTSIGDSAFYGCSSLTSVTIPEGVTSIGDSAFSGCSSLTSVTIPSSVTSIGGSAFSGCSSLTSVTIPEGVTSIGGYAFYGCSSLTSVTIPEGVTSIGGYAFFGCSNLTTIFFLGDAPSFGYDSFGYDRTAGLYPVDNETWTADKRQNYGGSLTWVGYRDEAKAYTIHYDPNGGSNAPADQLKGHGVDIALTSNTPFLNGYSFVGWATDPNAAKADYVSGATYTLDQDITLYAVWSLNTYTVSYNANGGSGAPESQTKTYGVDLTLSDTVPTRTGYTFQGWSTSSYSSASVNYLPGGTYSGNSDLTLYAVWKAETYTVHFDLNGGKPGYNDNDTYFPGDLTKTYGQSLRLDAYAHREGHRFLGWARDPAATEAEYAAYDYYYDNAPVTLYAVWKVYTFPVVYVVGKGAVGPESTVKTWGVDLTLSDMVPTAEGYDFMGWSLYNESNIPDYQPGDVYTGNGYGYEGSEIRFYALWQTKIYLVSYHANGGDDAPAPQLKYHGRSLKLSEEVPTREGYIFLGWSADKWSPVAEYQPGDSFTANRDTRLYALWESEASAMPIITEQPGNISVTEGESANFSVTASGNDLSYQWYFRTSSDAAWKAVSAASGKTAAYSLTAAERHNGYQYRCKVSNAAGSVYTDTVTLTVKPKLSAPSITAQPKNLSVAVGATAKFTVAASGEELSYQWYYRNGATGTWSAVSAASGKTASYSLTAAERHNGYQYRCLVSNRAGSVYSEMATLTVKSGLTAPTITTQPANVTVALGKNAKFTVAASGDELSYQWYYRTSSDAAWKAVSAASGKTANYSFTTAERHNGYQYRCKISNSAGSVTSKIVTLTVSGAKPAVVSQPKNVTVKEGDTASFTVKAAGTELSYQWYFRTSSDAAWKAVSAASGKTASYSLTAAERHNGYQYRCTISNAAGSVTSSIVTLTVNS